MGCLQELDGIIFYQFAGILDQVSKHSFEKIN